MIRRIASVFVILIILIAAAIGAQQWLVDQLAAPGPSASQTTIIAEKGAGLLAIGRQLAAAGTVSSSWLFAVEVRVAGNPSLKAGEYAFPAHSSIGYAIETMQRGKVVEHKLTVPEGLTVKQVVALIEQAPEMKGGLLRLPAEGSLLPQTYFYVYDDPRDALIARMAAAQSQLLDILWAARAPDLPLADEKQALILASVVEKETSLPAERPHIAAVYENRLRVGMKLESDPTVIYAASSGAGVLDRPISRADLALTNPYNTYMNEGLPPGPICNPGKASIEAVLHPMASDDLYFVADGSGGHAFAKTLAQHNKNVEKWRQIEKNQTAGTGSANPKN